MRAWIVAAVLAVAVAGGCADDPEATCEDPAGARREVFDFDAVAAVAAPDSVTGDRAWYVASPTGGLWVSTVPLDGSDGGLVFPLNDAARAESDVGVDVESSAAVLDGYDAGSDEARAALDCAQDPAGS